MENFRHRQGGGSSIAKAIGQIYRRPAWLVDRYNIRISEVAPVFAKQGTETTLAPMMFGLAAATVAGLNSQMIIDDGKSLAER